MLINFMILNEIYDSHISMLILQNELFHPLQLKVFTYMYS